MAGKLIQPLIIRVKNRSFANAEELTIPCDGCNFFRIRAATADFSVRFNGGTAVKLSAGQSYRSPENLESVTIVNDSGSTNIVDFFVANNDLSDDAMTLNGSLNISKSSSVTTMTDVTISAGGTASLFTSSATHRVRLIRNLSSNLYPIRVAGGAPASDAGIEVMPGETIAVETTGSMSAYNPAPVDQTVSLLRTID